MPSSASSCWHKLSCTSRNPLSPASAHVSGLLPGCEQGLHSQSLFLAVWAETWTQGSKKRSWCWDVAFLWPLDLYCCTSLSTDIYMLETMLGYKGTYGHSHPGEAALTTVTSICLSHLNKKQVKKVVTGLELVTWWLCSLLKICMLFL